MTDWDDLKEIIAELRAQQPSPLTRWPDPSHDASPPFEVGLAPWAVSIAERLRDRFGDQIILTVGVMSYPSGQLTGPFVPAGTSAPAQPLDPAEATVALDGPAVVQSGHTLRHGLLVTNHSPAEILLDTNGTITADVIDPETGEVAGGYLGPQILPLVVFRIAPAMTERIPLLIGTTSALPRLGYAIPPGTWAIQATLHQGPDTRDSARKRTPPLPLTITG